MAIPFNRDAKLTVWVFQTGEPLHVDPGNPRPMRAMNLANALIKGGHRVVVWSSAFFHQEKRHRTDSYQAVRVNELLEIRLIPSRGYSKNIGPGRLMDHAQLGFGLKRVLAQESDVPDVAFVGYPPIEFASVAVDWLSKRNVPTLLDAKDQWPDIFIAPFPGALKPVAKLAFFPYFYLGKRAMRKATALSSMADSFLAWMREFARRQPHRFDGVYPLSPVDDAVSEAETKSAALWWEQQGVGNNPRVKRFFFVGSISQAFDFDPLFMAATLADKQGLPWQFIICGDGGVFEAVRQKFSKLHNVVMPGWIDRPKVIALSRLCVAGLAPYRNLPDFKKSVPNKVIDYMALGKPIISPLKGEVGKLIDTYQIGISYSDQDPDTLVNALQNLSSDDGLKDHLSENAANTYKQRFAGATVYSDLVTNLENLASQHYG